MTDTAEPQPGVVALRTNGPVLIALPITIPTGLRPWTASIWPAADGAGWGRELWAYDPMRRGWIIPPSCTHGTVIEIGAATNPTRRQPARTHTAWYAVAIAHDQHWLVCSDGFPDPASAHHHAIAITDRYRHGIIERYRTHGRTT